MIDLLRFLRMSRLRARALLRRRAMQRDLDEELQFHLDREIEEQINRGLSPEDATRAALRRFDGIPQTKDACRETWGTEPVANLGRDLKYAVRMVRKDRAFSAVAVLTIGLAVGANAIVFSVVHAVLMRPLAFPNAGRIVAALPKPDGRLAESVKSSGPDFDDFRRAATSFSALGAMLPEFTMTVSGRRDPALARCTAVSPEVFDIFGMKPLIGRVFGPEQYHADGYQVMLSEGYWRREFGGDPHVLGTTIIVDGSSAEIIGVMPAARDLFDKTELWMTYVPDFAWARQRDNRFLSVVGLLKPDVPPGRAALEMTAIYRRMPGVRPTAVVDVVSLQRWVTGAVAPSLLVLTGAVLLVLLIACVNLAGLMLARGGTRRREIAIRLSLGANRGRVMRQLVTETAVLTLAGGALGVAIATEGIRFVTRVNPGNLPRLDAIRLDSMVLLYLLALCTIVVAVVGVLPTVSFTRGHLFDALRTRRDEASRGHRRHAGLLVGAEIAIALVLLTGAGLLVRSFWLLRHAPLGFQPDPVLTLFLRISDSQPPPSRAAFYTQLLESIDRQPSVTGAAVSDCLPTLHAASADLLPTGTAIDRRNPPSADACFVSPNYFRALGIPLRRGRAFGWHDDAGSQPTVIVSDSVARRLWPGEDPIGKILAVNYRTLGRPTDDVPAERIVVGIVGDVRNRSIDSADGMAVYLPFLQDQTARSWRAMTLFVRTTGPPADLAETVRAEVRRLNHEVPITRVATVDEVIGDELFERRFTTGLLSGFAAVALLLAAIGLYGVLAHTVSQRTHEIGVRIALGATSAEVLAIILRDAIALVGAGLAAGVGGSWMITRVLQDVVYGVGTNDVTSFAGAAAVLVIVAGLACLVPAVRALKVDPLVALNSE